MLQKALGESKRHGQHHVVKTLWFPDKLFDIDVVDVATAKCLWELQDSCVVDKWCAEARKGLFKRNRRVSIDKRNSWLPGQPSAGVAPPTAIQT